MSHCQPHQAIVQPSRSNSPSPGSIVAVGTGSGGAASRWRGARRRPRLTTSKRSRRPPRAGSAGWRREKSARKRTSPAASRGACARSTIPAFVAASGATAKPIVPSIRSHGPLEPNERPSAYGSRRVITSSLTAITPPLLLPSLAIFRQSTPPARHLRPPGIVRRGAWDRGRRSHLRAVPPCACALDQVERGRIQPYSRAIPPRPAAAPC